MDNHKKYQLIGAAFGLGGRHLGAAHGPAILRQHGLVHRLRKLDSNLEDCGDVVANPQPSTERQHNMKNYAATLDYLKVLHEKINSIYSSGTIPLLVGGDHAISIASIASAAKFLRQKIGPKARLGVLWVDAHPDLNTEFTTPSGNIHGMSLGMLLGLGHKELAELGGFAPKLKSEDLVYIGLRDVDPPERELIKKLAITAYSMKEIDLAGIGQVCREAFAKLENSCDAFLISFDLDGCDPRYAPGVGTPQRGGLTYRESHLIMELAAQSKKLLTAEMVEYHPEFDIDGHTADLAIGLLESVLGKSIL